MPKNVVYQRAENNVWAYNGPIAAYIMPNEAWGNGTDGISGPNINTKNIYNGTTLGGGGWHTIGNATTGKENYYDWSNDYLWLPTHICISASAVTIIGFCYGMPIATEYSDWVGLATVIHAKLINSSLLQVLLFLSGSSL